MKLQKFENDDQGFIDSIQKIILTLSQKWKPNDLFVTCIDNWFDSKWINFSGTYMHEVAIWKESQVTIPPFHPNRVRYTTYYQIEEGEFVQSKWESPLHVFQQSSDNMQRGINKLTSNGITFWYSSNSSVNDEGCLMGYLVKINDCETFYLSFSKKSNWSLKKVLGISDKEINSILKS